MTQRLTNLVAYPRHTEIAMDSIAKTNHRTSSHSPVPVQSPGEAVLSYLHEWVVTVDHKKLGIIVHSVRTVFPGGRRGGGDVDSGFNWLYRTII